MASQAGHTKIVEKLLAADANVNLQLKVTISSFLNCHIHVN